MVWKILRQFCSGPLLLIPPLNVHFPIAKSRYKVQNSKIFACGALNKPFLPVLARRRRKFLQNRASASDFKAKCYLKRPKRGPCETVDYKSHVTSHLSSFSKILRFVK